MKLLLLALLLLPGLALAVPVTLEYQLPTTSCDGTPIAVADIEAMEIYVSAGPIAASDALCPPTGSPVDVPPASASAIVYEDVPDGTADIDLIGGVTYYVRARVRVDGAWSNLSNQVTRDVPLSPPSAPALIQLRF